MERSFLRLQDSLKGEVRMLQGPDGLKVICQQRHQSNLDLQHENWSESFEESMGAIDILITGDRGAGKTTFLAGLTSGEMQILQALRYDASSFYNIWYGAEGGEVAELEESLRTRRMGFFQTELAFGSMLLPAQEHGLFLDDDEFVEACEDGPEVPSAAAYTHVLVHVLEVGGDALRALPSPPAGKRGVYAAIRRVVAQASTVCFFARAHESQEALAASFETLLEGLRAAGGGDGVAGKRTLLVFVRGGGDGDCEGGAPEPVGLDAVKAAAVAAGFGRVAVYAAEHLQEAAGGSGGDVVVANTAVLHTFWRMLRWGTVHDGLSDTVIGQVLGVLMRHHETAAAAANVVTRESYHATMEGLHHMVEHGTVYDDTFQPLLSVPPSFLHSVYTRLMETLCWRERVCLSVPDVRRARHTVSLPTGDGDVSVDVDVHESWDSEAGAYVMPSPSSPLARHLQERLSVVVGVVSHDGGVTGVAQSVVAETCASSSLPAVDRLLAAWHFGVDSVTLDDGTHCRFDFSDVSAACKGAK